MEIHEFVFMLLALALPVVLFFFKEDRLRNSEDNKFVRTDQLEAVMTLKGEQVVAAVVRQSGNVHKELGEFPSPTAALREITKSLNRAQIESVVVLVNTDDRFEFIRLHNNARKNSGQKVGGGVIVRVN